MSALLFDLDGVLIDSWQAVSASFLEAAELCELDGRVRLDDFRARMGMPLQAIAAEFGYPDYFSAAFRAAALSRDHLVCAFPGVGAMLRTLRARGFAIGVVTGKDRPRTLKILQATGVAPLVDVVVTANDAPGKPAPDGLWLCERTLGRGPALAFVGDTEIDLAAARRAGRIALLAIWGGSPCTTMPPGVIEVSTPAEMLDVAEMLARSCAREAAQ